MQPAVFVDEQGAQDEAAQRCGGSSAQRRVRTLEAPHEPLVAIAELLKISAEIHQPRRGRRGGEIGLENEGAGR